MTPMLPFTMHGHVRPIMVNGCHGGAHAALGYARGLYASLGRDGSTPRGSGTSMPTLQGSHEAEIVPDGA
jgi:hypothetical protein